MADLSQIPTDQLVQMLASHPAVQQPSGPQPTLGDRIVASPLGRLAHDAIAAPIMGFGNFLSKFDPTAPDPAKTSALLEKPYQASLAANRNTPGYPAALATAQAAQAARPSGFTDQLTAPLNSAMAGIAGLPGGLDAMNANADVQSQAQDAYQKAHPLKSFVGGVVGGAGMPEAGAAPLLLQTQSTMKPGAQEAMNAGYVLSPRMISDSPGVGADLLTGWSGKIKTAQQASARNQDVTNALAATDLGLPADTTLTDKVLQQVRTNASKSYSAIPKAMPATAVDPQFLQDVNALGFKSSAASGDFPELMENPEIDKLMQSLTGKQGFSTDGGMQLVRKLRNDANVNFRAPDPTKADLAFAQRGAADAIDDLIERNLVAQGNPTLATDYKNARVQIAKSHDIEAATNTNTGNVSARKLATLSNRGRPLTGGMATIADAANAFPKALQSESAFGEAEPFSALDAAAAAVTAAHGNYGAAGALLGRPIARKIVLSGPMQRSIAAASGGRQLSIPNFQNGGALPYGSALPLMMLPNNNQ